MLSSGGGLQVPKPQFPSLNSPQRAAGGGGGNASSNGTRKVALAPGHSLMDWIRLGQREGRKLNGVGGQVRHVSVDELARHNKVDDAWMSIRGKVYNVTPYMSFHPGGEDEMMRGVGGDGTSLFDDVHQWVNVESMLEKCYVGPLKKSIDLSKPSSKGVIKRMGELRAPSASTLAPPAPVNTGTQPASVDLEPLDSQKPKARYDWYQNSGKITVTIYAKCKCVSTEHLVIDREHRDLRVTLFLDDHVYTVHVDLFEDVTSNYEGIRVIAGPIHRVIFVVNKKNPEVKWASLGKALEGNNSLVPRIDKEPVFRRCKVVSCQPLTHDIKLFGLELPAGCRMCLPMGYHVHLRVRADGNELSRPYTAITPSVLAYSQPSLEATGRVIHLMIKIYPSGQLTQCLARLVVGDTVDVSDYEGSFVDSRLHQADRLTLVAAGTGFTPMVKLLQWSLGEQRQRPKRVKLIFFNKTEADIPWRDDLAKLAETRRRSLEVVHVLSEPDQGWAGPKGRIREELVEDLFWRPARHPNERFLTCICGPTPFTQLAFKLSKAHGYTDEMIHVFAA
ncbi:cytochrome b5 reductase 4-like [Acanthaster planci]|uniref:Cytochrome b5 reductase 4 n=1 Tax=Acanthaster planci TaxID=133434 RepID=A0A8B7XPW2_ACAPL|nr:cytochrome b5 reductase 4-like [Acanthaster planci]XP_022082087.1 cytochrome b5 reductase 4-like [Acanthaster planci]